MPPKFDILDSFAVIAILNLIKARMYLPYAIGNSVPLKVNSIEHISYHFQSKMEGKLCTLRSRSSYMENGCITNWHICSLTIWKMTATTIAGSRTSLTYR